MVKWLAILLVVVNVAVFFLARDESVEKAPVAAAPMAKNMNKMVLQTELGGTRADAIASVPAQNVVVEETISVADPAAEVLSMTPLEAPSADALASAVSVSASKESVTQRVASHTRRAVDEAVEQAQAEAQPEQPAAGAVPPEVVTEVDQSVTMPAQGVDENHAPKQESTSPAIISPAAAPSVEADSPQKVVLTPAQPAPQEEVAVTNMCYEVTGLSAKEMTKVKATLSSEGVLFRERRDERAESDQEKVKAVRVYAGPYSSETEAAQQLAVLKAKGLDAYATTRAQGRIIQLGYFSKSGEAVKNAKAYQITLKSKGVEAKLATESSLATPRYVLAYEATEAMHQRLSQKAKYSAKFAPVKACR